MVFDATFWATLALFVFIGVMLYLGVPKMIAKALDTRIKKIEAELAEAERLRAEAKALLEEYARKREEAEKEAEDIVAAAREEAFRLTAEASQSLETLIARRTRAVEEKISQAEAQAVAEVRSRSADLAVEAARLLLARQMVEKGDALVEPTESESKQTLDRFCEAMLDLAQDAKAGNRERFTAAPAKAPRRRLDETRAARSPKLKWEPAAELPQAAE